MLHKPFEFGQKNPWIWPILVPEVRMLVTFKRSRIVNEWDWGSVFCIGKELSLFRHENSPNDLLSPAGESMKVRGNGFLLSDMTNRLGTDNEKKRSVGDWR